MRYDEREQIADAWSEVTGQPACPTFGNQGCRLDDIGGIELGDDVLPGPGVRLISSGHPLDPALRRRRGRRRRGRDGVTSRRASSSTVSRRRMVETVAEEA